jgi:hypothetical protein
MLPSWASQRARNAVMRRGAQAEGDASGAGLAADVIVAPGRRSAGPTPSNAVVRDGEWRCRLPSRISPAVVANVRAGSRQVTTGQTYFGGVRGGLLLGRCGGRFVDSVVDLRQALFNDQSCKERVRVAHFSSASGRLPNRRPEPVDLAKKTR